MTLHQIWEMSPISTPCCYKYFDDNDECIHINVYDPDDERFTRGVDTVSEITREILPVIGSAIICILEQEEEYENT